MRAPDTAGWSFKFLHPGCGWILGLQNRWFRDPESNSGVVRGLLVLLFRSTGRNIVGNCTVKDERFFYFGRQPSVPAHRHMYALQACALDVRIVRWVPAVRFWLCELPAACDRGAHGSHYGNNSGCRSTMQCCCHVFELLGAGRPTIWGLWWPRRTSHAWRFEASRYKPERP